uniref:Microtubule associated protein 9 n=1 Tax=Chelydra serpentina TaxID=8475 RepID=A0A8C3SSQ0_CHESE
MSDENIGTTLAYTKSPKVSRRTTFQDELQEAISARAARQQTAEYSDDFDSDEDGMLNSSSFACVLPLPAFADRSLMVLWSQYGLIEDEIECSFIEKSTCHGNEGDHCNESHMAVLHNEREEITQREFENKPVPKLREHRIKNISSAENVSISALNDRYKPSPQPRSVLRKSSHVEDKDVARAEDKASSSYRLPSFSAPSSLTRLSDKITSEKRALAESPSPEVRALLDLKLENNGRKSPSVIELMMTTVYEKTKKLQKSTDDQLEENLQRLEEKLFADGIKEMSLNDKSEDMAEVSTSEDLDKVSFKHIILSLSSTYLKKAGKTIPPSTTTSAQYLGTLKVLDNKHLQKYSAELDKADSLRAAVYQVNFGISKYLVFLSIFRNEKKEEFVKQKKTEKSQEKRQQEIEQVVREEKDKRAMEEYERWLVNIFFHTLLHLSLCF